MKNLVLISLLVLIASCSPKTRFTRLIEKHPYLLTVDSVTIHDTIRVVVPEVHVDTFVKVKALLDTVYLEKEQLKVKVWMKGDNVYIQGKCDTVYVDKIIERKIPVKYYEKTPWWKRLLNNTLGFFIIFVLVYALYKLYQKLL
jgi:hypothetical protein